MSRENEYSALSNITDKLSRFLKDSAPDFQALGSDPDHIRQEITDLLRDLFSDQLEFVSERFEVDPMAWDERRAA